MRDASLIEWMDESEREREREREREYTLYSHVAARYTDASYRLDHLTDGGRALTYTDLMIR